MTETDKLLADQKNTAAINTSISIGDTSQIIAIAIATCYICGFIVVMAYLGSFGIKDYEAFHTQYIISGATLLLIVGLYYYFVGRHVLAMDEDTIKYQQLFSTHGAKGKFWEFCAFTYALWELGFFIVIASIVGSSLLFTVSSTRTLLMIVPMVLGYFWIDLVLTSKASESIGKLFWLLVELFYLTVFIAFFWLADGIILSFLYFILAVTGTAFIFSNSLKSIRSTKTSKIFLTYFFIFGLVTASGAFGRYFYGQVRASIGGGKPEQVRVVIDDSITPIVLQRELNVAESTSSAIDLIAQTDSEIFLGYPLKEPNQGYKTLIRLDRKLVKAIISNDLSVIKYTKAE